MEEKIEEIKNRTKLILNSHSIDILKDEAEIIETLNKISNTNGIDIYYDERTLECIERYLKSKQKMKMAEEDIDFWKIYQKI